MSSLAKGLGGYSPYPILNDLTPKEIQHYKNVVLLVIDGLGYDYVKMKEKYTITDAVVGKKEHFNTGDHGAVSEEEMYVPLITIPL